MSAGTTAPEAAPGAVGAASTGPAAIGGQGAAVGVDPVAAAEPEAPTLTWKQRMAIDVDGLKRDDALLYMKVRTAIPDDDDPNDPAFIRLLTKDRRSAGVILARLLSRSEPDEIRVILAEQLPYTRGDWEEGASVLIRLDPDPRVRKALVGTMRFAKAPHASAGLAGGLRDEDDEVRGAAARTAGFQPDAATIEDKLVACMGSDSDWETRAAVARSLGALGLRSAFPALIEALRDRDPRVRVEVLGALERIDLAAAAEAVEVRALARGGDRRVVAAAKRILQRAWEAASASEAAAAAAAPAATPPAASAPAPASPPLRAVR